jgi:magnesium transporter
LSAPEELLERIRLRLDESFAGIGEVVAELAAADLGELLNQLNLQEAASVASMLAVPRAIEVFDQPTLHRRSAILEQMEPGRASQVLEGLSADQRTEVIRGMGELSRRRLLPKLSEAMRAEVERLLQYPPRSAGGIMTTEFVRLAPGMTVSECLKHIRTVARERESIYACYVLEPGTGKLLGAVSLRDLVMAELEQPVERAMRRKPVTVRALDDQEKVAEKIAKYNLLAVPVLEKDDSVVGFVTVDDVIDVLNEEATEDVFKMAAIESDAGGKPYFQTSIGTSVRRRIGWLMLLFLAQTLTGSVMRHYQSDLAAVVALSFFVPLLIGTGGNAGAQTVTTIIRSLALGEIRKGDARHVLARELSTGVVIGLLVGGVALAWALMFGAHFPLAVTIGVTVVAICTWSTAVGSIVPILAQRFGVDPALLSAPMITTLVDATGLIIYFQIAKLVLGL